MPIREWTGSRTGELTRRDDGASAAEVRPTRLTAMTADPGRRFVVCGETLIDLVRDPNVLGDTFSSGWSALSAGGPMNTAVALAMLGGDSHFLGRISTDEFGRQLR